MFSSLFTQNKAVKGLIFTTALQKDKSNPASRWIESMCGFLLGDKYSPVGFCIPEIPVYKLFKQSKGYRIGEPGKRTVKRIHRLSVDDLEQYHESYKTLKRCERDHCSSKA